MRDDTVLEAIPYQALVDACEARWKAIDIALQGLMRVAGSSVETTARAVCYLPNADVLGLS